MPRLSPAAGLFLVALTVSFEMIALPARAQTLPATTPTTARSEGPAKLTVIEVVRLVRVRQTSEQPYQLAKVGMVLDEGAEFQTGPGARARISIPPDQIVTIDRLTTCRVLRARVGADGTTASTDLGMQYGRTQYEVEAAGVEHDSSIRSPGSTLAVRGTRNMVLYDHGPFPPLASASQPVEFRNLRRQIVRFGQVNRVVAMSAADNSPAETSLESNRADPVPSQSRSIQENAVTKYLDKFPGVELQDLGVLAYLDQRRFPGFSGSVVGALPIDRTLQFQLRWFNVPLADLDFSVTAPNGRTIDINNPSVDTGLGTRGIFQGGPLSDGSNGVADSTGFGIESIELPNGFPTGNYHLTARVSAPGSRGGGNISVTFVAVQLNPAAPKDKPIVLSRTNSLAPTVGNAASRTFFADLDLLRESTPAAAKSPSTRKKPAPAPAPRSFRRSSPSRR